MFTIGHSNLPIESFLRALRENDVRRLIDVRTIPRSRHNPQFNSDALEVMLREAGIAYRHAPELERPAQDVAGVHQHCLEER